jgi:hypothetical protein
VTADYDFRRVVGQAALAEERATACYQATHLDPIRVEQRIDAWQQTIAGGDDVAWQRYLTLHGWSQAQLATLCSDTVFVGDMHELPSWALVLWEAWDDVLTAEQLSSLQTLMPTLTSHDGAVILPFVTWGIQTLYAGDWPQRAILPQPTVLATWLVQQLHAIVGDTATQWVGQQGGQIALPRSASRITPLLHDTIWREFAVTHAWMMRSVATAVWRICQTIQAACIHLVQDWGKLRQHYHFTGQVPTIEALENAPLGYATVGGFGLQCANQQRLIYVPHSAPKNDGFAVIHAWLQRRGAPLLPQLTQTVPGPDYYWVQLPPARAPHDSEYAAYAQSIGALAALCDICGIVDLTAVAVHCVGAQLWLLDATSMATPHPTPLAHRLVHVNGSDTMAVFHTSLAQLTRPQQHAVLLDDYVAEVITGYQQCSDFVMQRATDLAYYLQGQAPFAQRIMTHQSDVLWHYRNLLHAQPLLSNGIEVSACIDQLCGQIPPQLDSIATRQQLHADLVGGILPYVMNPQQDYATVITNLKNSTPHTQQFQIAQLQLALTPCEIDYTDGRIPWVSRTLAPLDTTELAQEAVRIAYEIHEQQIVTTTGSTWLVLGHDAQRTGLHYANPSLIDGTSGIALALSCIGGLTDKDTLTNTAIAAFQQTFATMSTMPQAVGGICYAVAMATPHLATYELCHTLWQQLSQVNMGISDTLQSADWPHGLASMVIGYLALHRIDPQRGWQQQAIVAGERLLQSRQRNAQNERTWAGASLSNGGFGTSGIALAFVRLYEYSRDYRFLRAVYEIIQLQDNHYSADHGGWPDTRTQPWSYPLSWCHGSIGPGMVRLALQRHERTGQIDASLLGLLDGIDSIGLHENDGLCCGTAGSIDLLLSVDRELHQPYYSERANYWVQQMIQRAHDRGGYVTAAEYPGIYQQPTLFQGTAGIAYQIARCAYPRLFPSLLFNTLPRGTE